MDPDQETSDWVHTACIYLHLLYRSVSVSKLTDNIGNFFMFNPLYTNKLHLKCLMLKSC